MKKTFLQLLEMQLFFEDKSLSRRATDLDSDFARKFLNLAYKATTLHSLVFSEKVKPLSEGLKEATTIYKDYNNLVKACKESELCKDKNVPLNHYVLMSHNLILKTILDLERTKNKSKVKTA